MVDMKQKGDPTMAQAPTHHAEPARRPSWHINPGLLAGRVVVHVVVLAALVFMLVPFLWMLSTAFKAGMQVFDQPPDWIPSPIITDNFQSLLSLVPFGTFYLNSFIVAGTITVGQLLFCSSAAFAFARLHFPGRNLLFGIYLSSLFVPVQVTIIPLYVLIKHLGLLDTLPSLIVPSLTSAFGTFLLRQFFLSIPVELEDAARVDGAGPFRILTTIFIPLSGSALATLAIFTFNFFWNEFFRPLIFLSTVHNMTIPLGLAFVVGDHSQGQSVVMAGVTLAVIPVLIVYLFAQRYIIQGIALTGLKG
jgi:multiple sugar transport system permease protein